MAIPLSPMMGVTRLSYSRFCRHHSLSFLSSRKRIYSRGPPSVSLYPRSHNFSSTNHGQHNHGIEAADIRYKSEDDPAGNPSSIEGTASSLSSSSSSGDHSKYTNQEILQRLYDLSKPERTLIIASAATLGITSSITLLLPYACGHVLDMAIISTTDGANDSSFNPLYISAGLFTLTCTAGLGVALRTTMLNIAGNRIVRRIRTILFASILSQESGFMDQHKSGDLISRLSNDAYFIKNVVTTEAVSGLRAVVMSVGSTSLLFYTSPTLALVSLMSIPPVFLAGRMVGRRLRVQQKSVQALHGKAINVAEEVFGGFKTVQLFHAEQFEYDRYSQAVSEAHEKEISVGKTKAVFDGVVHVAANGAVLLVLGYGGTLVLASQMTAGDLTGFLMYSLLMAGNLSSLSGTYAEMVKSVAAAGRTFEIIDRVPQIPSSFRNEQKSLVDESRFMNSKDVITETADGHREAVSISFNSLKFAYPARPDVPVLGPDFSLEIKAGENIALVGGSGSGKSTVGLLLARLYNLEDGSILINGHNIKTMDPTFLRKQIGVVSQVSINQILTIVLLRYTFSKCHLFHEICKGPVSL